MKYKEALKQMIKGETEAHHIYQAFSKKAKEENLAGVALLFKSLAAAELIHIKNHQNALNEEYTPTLDEPSSISDTKGNISSAIAGEREESKNLYPKLMKSIKKELTTLEGKVANLSLQWAMQAEKNHLKLLKEALKAANTGQDFSISELYICKVCGNIVLTPESEKECALCGHDKIFFRRIDA